MRTRETLEGILSSSADNEELLSVIGEILLDIRDLLERPAEHCPDCCYVTHGGHPSDERVRLQR